MYFSRTRDVLYTYTYHGTYLVRTTLVRTYVVRTHVVRTYVRTHVPIMVRGASRGTSGDRHPKTLRFPHCLNGGSESVGVCCPAFAPSFNWLPCILSKHTWCSVHKCALFQSEVVTYIVCTYHGTLVRTRTYTYTRVRTRVPCWQLEKRIYVCTEYCTTGIVMSQHGYIPWYTCTRVRTTVPWYILEFQWYPVDHGMAHVTSQLSTGNGHTFALRTTCVLGRYTAASREKERMQGNTHLHSRYRPHVLKCYFTTF
jgi:hypothetical protein